MELGHWCLALAQARRLGCRRVQFIGGEPTVHPDLVALIEYARDVGYRQCVVSTNATRLTDDLLEAFARLAVEVSISFYSFDPQTHDRITARAGAFDKTIGGIERLIERRIPVRAGVIEMEENQSHLRRTRRLLRRMGVVWIGTDRVRGIGRGRSYVPTRRPAEELCGGCWQGKLCLAPNGDAYPCVFSRFFPVGNFLTDGLERIVESGKLHAFRRAVYLGEEGE